MAAFAGGVKGRSRLRALSLSGGVISGHSKLRSRWPTLQCNSSPTGLRGANHWSRRSITSAIHARSHDPQPLRYSHRIAPPRPTPYHATRTALTRARQPSTDKSETSAHGDPPKPGRTDARATAGHSRPHRPVSVCLSSTPVQPAAPPAAQPVSPSRSAQTGQPKPVSGRRRRTRWRPCARRSGAGWGRARRCCRAGP